MVGPSKSKREKCHATLPLLLESVALWPAWFIIFQDSSISDKKHFILKGKFLKKTIPSPSKQHTKLANLWGHSHIPKIVVFLEARGMTN